jgi:hypothetical protein
VGVQDVRWDGRDTELAGEYTLFCGRGTWKLVMIMALRVVNFATSKNLIVKNTMFPQHNIHKFNRTFLDGKMHNQSDHILIDMRWHSGVPDVQLFRAADCDTDHNLLVEKLSERLVVSKQTMHGVHMGRLNLKK